MAKGIVRKIDELGRITIPMEYRKSFGIKVREQAPIGMSLINGVIHLTRADEKFRGISRELDELGRLTLPIEVRRSLKFTDRQEVDIYVDEEEICVCKAGNECAHCGSDSRLIKVDDSAICLVCLRKANLKAKECSL